MKVAAFMRSLSDSVSPCERERLQEMLAFESNLWQQGFCRLAGVDEAGRGPLAGPIVAAAVVLKFPHAGLNDSKRLSESQRDRLYLEIIEGGHDIGVAVVSAAEIDARGIQQANHAAMRIAVSRLTPPPDFVLVDGYRLHGLAQPALQVIKGDSRSLSIAAASVIAKVTRDRIMTELDGRYPEYGFSRHKGYGTREHMAAIASLGACPEHRKSFAPFSSGRAEKELF